MTNTKLKTAQQAKKDEFYTRYADVAKEMDACLTHNPGLFQNRTVLLPCDDPDRSNFTRYFTDNFTRLGLRRLISTSYNPNGRGDMLDITRANRTRQRLDGDGDFRSTEITRFRDQTDFVITNPPFSLFREFLPWMLDSGKRFTVIGNVNAITYKDIFPLLKNRTIRLGASIHGGARLFDVPDTYPLDGDCCGIDENGRRYIRVKGVRWYTNMEYGQTPPPLHLDTMAHNLHHNRKLRDKLEHDYGRIEYPRYDNYDAIEIPFVDAIPSDYMGVMGVPVTFLDKHNPTQFELVGSCKDIPGGLHITGSKGTRWPYYRLLIRRRQDTL